MKLLGDRIKAYPWRLFLVLWLLGSMSTPLIIPYGSRLIEIAPNLPPLPDRIWLTLLIYNILVCAFCVGLGLILSRRLGLGAPYLEAWLYGAKPPSRFVTIVPTALLTAVIVSIAIIAIDGVAFLFLGVSHPAPEIHARIPGVEAWRGIPLAIHASIIAELKYRLFSMSLIAWLVIKLPGSESERRRITALWIALVVSSLIYGNSYLSAVEWFGQMSPVVVLRTYLIILLPGLAFGYLFWKRGLESAILCHFAIDIIVHVLRPLIE